MDVAGVETGVAHDLHAFWRDVRDQTGGEIESGASDCLAQTCGGVDVPVGDVVGVVVDDV